MSSSAPSMPRKSSPAKILLVIILGLGGALAGILFFGPGGGFAATRAGIFSGSRSTDPADFSAQPPPISDTTMAPVEAPGAGRRGTGAALAAVTVDGTVPAQGAQPQAMAAGTAQTAGAAHPQAPQTTPTAVNPIAAQQGPDPFLLPATGQPSASSRNAGLGSMALAPTPAFPQATAPPAAAPTFPSGYSGFGTGASPSGSSGMPGFPALPLPLPQPSVATSPFGLRCSDIPRDENSLRMGFLPIGAMVLDVSAGSEGALAGLTSGDRIVRAGGQPIVSASHFLFLTTQHKGGPFDVELIRGGVLYRATLGNAGSVPR